MIGEPPAWAEPYIGIPYLNRGRGMDGCDCWGLVRMVITDQTGVAIPSFETEYERDDDFSRVGAVVDREKRGATWRWIDPGQEKPLDVAQMNTASRSSGEWKQAPLHAGVIVAPGWLLHVEEKTAACLLRYRETRRVLAFWRHAAFA